MERVTEGVETMINRKEHSGRRTQGVLSVVKIDMHLTEKRENVKVSDAVIPCRCFSSHSGRRSSKVVDLVGSFREF